MKRRTFLIIFLLLFIAELSALLLFAARDTDYTQNAVTVNEVVQSVQSDWHMMDNHKNRTDLDYTVLDADGNILFKTRPGLSETINMAVIHRDTILNIRSGNLITGTIIIYNDSSRLFRSRQQSILAAVCIAMTIQLTVCMAYFLYLNHTIIIPFQGLKTFAERVAAGNFDFPLSMDRHNLFGAFTESFDIMRSELKKAQIAEAKAKADKKELVAKLSHDIKTPAASIKAASEVGAALTHDSKLQDNYAQIICKADQINNLVTNLFTATLEELRQLSVTPDDINSGELEIMLGNADYLHHACIPPIPECMLYADKLRLQQVFDNIFSNSYKYAKTPISLTIAREDCYLSVKIEDYGEGVGREELLHVKEKFWRGSNTGNIEGSGLGLYISDYFMKNMQGRLIISKEERGFIVTVKILLSGLI